MQHEYAIFVSAVSPVSAMNTRGISATRNMKSKLAIKFPTSYEWWSNALPPGQKEVSNDVIMFKLRFDWYITAKAGATHGPVLE